MARVTVSPGTSRDQTTDAAPGFTTDEQQTATLAPRRVRDPLPYAEVDVLARESDSYLAGGALLAGLVRQAVDARPDAGGIDKAEAEAAGAAALAKEAALLGELSTPAQSLTDVTVKLVYAWRVAWWGNHGGAGVYGDAALELVASALSDVILMREAELVRRHKLGERAS